jgi:hypothetical protein
MIGLWAYRRSQDKAAGGLWLAILLLKPQLGLFPLAWAVWRWYKAVRCEHKIPQQFWVFAVSISVLYLPWFFINPNWVVDWLSYPRGLRYRAMAGIYPRLLYGLPPWIFWPVLAVLALVLLAWLVRRGLTLDRLVVYGSIVSPLVHDYDLLQFLAIADTDLKRRFLVFASLPLWWTFLFAYGNDAAWFTAALIPPMFLWYLTRTKPLNLSKEPSNYVLKA